MTEETELELSEPEDVRSVQTFLLYLRHMPVTYIEKAQGISRRTVYRDLDRAREIFKLDENFSRDLFFETAEGLREAWQNYQSADNKLRQMEQQAEPASKEAVAQRNGERIGLEIQKSTYLGMVDKMLKTRIKAAELLTPKTESISFETAETDKGTATRFTLKRESKNVGVLLEELRKEGKIGNTS